MEERIMMKYIRFGIVAALAFVLAGCVGKDMFDASPEAIVMTGTDNSPLIKFAVEEAPSAYPVTVSATGEVTEDITVSIAVDNSLVEKYNEAHKTSYYALPESAISLEKSSVVIKAGSAASETSLLSVVSTDDFVDGRIYVIPVTITGVKGGNLDVLETSRTAYIRISRVYYFPALDLSNTNLYANYIFPDDKAMELPTHTVEVKFYANSWHSSTSEPISRMLGIYDKNEAGYLYRIGENGLDKNQLQVNKSNAAAFNSATRFSENTWYTLTVTYDGSATRLYVDGVRDSEMSNGGPLTFQRIELGMSWGGYRTKQYFDGRIAEIRIWDRVLSASEIQLGLCGVDPKSEGLRAYWKFNEGEGHIFHDATGNGYDIDWSKVCRDANEDGPLEDYDYSAEVNWLDDDKNRCAN